MKSDPIVVFRQHCEVRAIICRLGELHFQYDSTIWRPLPSVKARSHRSADVVQEVIGTAFAAARDHLKPLA